MRTRFILVCLLYLCGLCISQDCSPKFLENVDLMGADTKILYSPDPEHCQLLCTQHPSCHFFTFVRPDTAVSATQQQNQHFHCHLKSSPSGQPLARTPLQGVTSGFSLKPCNPDPQPCLSQVYQDVDFPGADYQTLFTIDSEECQRACTNNRDCQFFTFLNGNYTPAQYRYKCHLKFSWTVPRTTKVEVNAALVSGFSHNVQITQQSDTACQTKFFTNTKISGHNIENLSAVTHDHCLALCSAHPQCTYFSYNSQNFRCNLKNNPNEMVMKAEVGVTSGIPAHFCQLDNAWVKTPYTNVDFWGSDYHDVLAEDVEACQRTCTQDPNCQFYTFVSEKNFNRHICYMKRVISMPAPPKVTKVANVVSGFSLRSCVSSAQPTHTHVEEELFISSYP